MDVGRIRIECQSFLKGSLCFREVPEKEHIGNSLLDDPAGADMDSILRTATLTQVLGASVRLVIQYLNRAANLRVFESDRYARGDEEMSRSAIETISVYRWMQRLHLSTRLSTEARVLRQVAAGFLQTVSPKVDAFLTKEIPMMNNKPMPPFGYRNFQTCPIRSGRNDGRQQPVSFKPPPSAFFRAAGPKIIGDFRAQTP